MANPSLNRVFRGRGKTAFERNLLPGFARWILDEIDRREPDYLIPVETKGALGGEGDGRSWGACGRCRRGGDAVTMLRLGLPG